MRSCPDFYAFAQLSCIQPTFVRSTGFRAFMTRLSCVLPIFVRSCPDFRAFNQFSCVHVQISVRLQDLFAHDQIFLRSSHYWCVYDQTFVRSSGLSCVQIQTFVRSSDSFVLSCLDFFVFFCVSRLCKFERTTYRLSAWKLILGTSAVRKFAFSN